MRLLTSMTQISELCNLPAAGLVPPVRGSRGGWGGREGVPVGGWGTKGGGGRVAWQRGGGGGLHGQGQ